MNFTELLVDRRSYECIGDTPDEVRERLLKLYYLWAKMPSQRRGIDEMIARARHSLNYWHVHNFFTPYPTKAL